MSFLETILQEGVKDRTAGIFPFSLGVEVTNWCNLRCPMCPREEGERGFGNMDFELFTSLVDQALAHRHGLFLPQGFGESFIHPRFGEMLAYIHERNLKRPVMVITNGTLLTPRHCDELIDAAVDLVSISLDSMDKAVFESLRVAARLEAVVQNVHCLLRRREERGLEQPRVILRMIRMDRTRHLTEGFRRYWEPYLKPGDEISFSAYQTWNGAVEDHRSESSAIDRLRARGEPLPPCRMLYKTMQVFFDGRTTPCCYDFRCSMEIGNAKEQTLAEIWQGKRARHFRRLHEEGRLSEIPVCRNCKEFVP